MDQFESLGGLREEIHKEKLSLYNRIHSIHEDAQWITTISALYAPLPVVANERCGSWYVEPSIKSQHSAYFKSTDGHFGRWEFSLRRANLHLLPVIQQSNGIIVVDSTRRGKRYPDALSKTIPLWCAVINTSIKEVYMLEQWDNALYTSPIAVSRSEHDQMAAKVDAYAQALVSSSFKLPRLSKPLRPMWVTPDSQSPPVVPTAEGEMAFLPVICVSASKLVEEGGVERRLGYTYVQGSGDDHEQWSQGLDPQALWENASMLLSAQPDELESIVHVLLKTVSRASNAEGDEGTRMRMPRPAMGLSPIVATNSRLLIGQYNADGSTELRMPDACTALIIIHNSVNNPTLPESDAHSNILHLSLPAGKRGRSQLLENILPLSVAFAKKQLDPSGVNRHNGVLGVVCHDGKDISVGVGMAIIQALFDDDGTYVGEQGRSHAIDKSSLRTRLQWIQTSRPQANPSRATLQRLNEFFMSERFVRPSRVASGQS